MRRGRDLRKRILALFYPSSTFFNSVSFARQ